MRNLNNYLTPFISPENKNNVLFSGNVNTSLDVIISNLEELFSSAFCNGRFSKDKFAITRFNTGLTTPEVRTLTNKKKEHFLKEVTRADKLFLKGYLQFPQEFMRYSQINLPKTKIGHRSSLNIIPFNYFSYINKKAVAYGNEYD